jgi:hypothetical protein
LEIRCAGRGPASIGHRFLIDECLSAALVAVAKARGFEADHVTHIGKTGWQDWNLVPYAVANHSWDGNDVYGVDVRNATTQRFTGLDPAIRLEDLRIKENIKTFFEQRDCFSSENLRQATQQFRNIAFFWRIGK